MGLESACTMIVGRSREAGAAHLDAKEFVFHGKPRLSLPISGATLAASSEATLRITVAGKVHTFEMPSTRVAAHWAGRINNPRSRMDKLGILAKSRVLVINIDDADFDAELAERLALKVATRPAAGSSYDVILAAFRDTVDLKQLKKLGERLAPGGKLWALWPKGRKDLRHEEVASAGKAAGLSQTISAAFNDELTGLRLVIPKNRE